MCENSSHYNILIHFFFFLIYQEGAFIWLFVIGFYFLSSGPVFTCVISPALRLVTALRKPLNPRLLSATRSSSACFSQYLFVWRSKKSLQSGLRYSTLHKFQQESVFWGRYWEVETLGNHVKFSFLHLPPFIPVGCFKLFLSFLSHSFLPSLLPLFLTLQLYKLLIVLHYAHVQNGPDLCFLVYENSASSIDKLTGLSQIPISQFLRDII